MPKADKHKSFLNNNKHINPQEEHREMNSESIHLVKTHADKPASCTEKQRV